MDTKPLRPKVSRCPNMTSGAYRVWLIVLTFVSILFLALPVAAGEDYKPEFSDKPPLPQTTEFIFAVHPLHNPERLYAVYGPIADYLSAKIPNVRFRLEASRNYEEYERKLFARHFHFALPNPYQTMRSLKYGYRVFGKMGDDDNFRGIILVRADSSIEKVSDLKGKKISYPAATALAATIMPQYYLHTHGLDINRDVENVYVGSQESSIMNVYHGYVAAGATWPVPWRKFEEQYPDKARSLLVKWQTESLPNNALVVRDDVPTDVVEKVASLLFSLQENEVGHKLLEAIPLSRFEPASNETYEAVRIYIRRFSAEVRPLSE
jgi:phosphonate transport system substrate-binding protein